MDRKAMAKETMEILKQGYYEPEETSNIRQNDSQKSRQIRIKEAMEQSVRQSVLISPADGERLLKAWHLKVCKERKASSSQPETRVENISTVEAIRILAAEGKVDIGVLNFASAKNPGGGFLNGAKAQEESLAVSSTLYPTLIAHEEYYRENRAYRSMMYLDYGIYSPEVLFFRDETFRLTDTPAAASVLTLPAVNMGQVLRKGEAVEEAKRVMRRRMKLALAIFAEQKAKHLVLGAYGCGVFQNDPREIAGWWSELLEEGIGGQFDSVFHAVFDHSKEGACIRAFREQYITEKETKGTKCL